MAKYKIEIEIEDEVIRDAYRYEPTHVGEIMNEFFSGAISKELEKQFKTKKGKFKSKGQVTRILNKLREE